MNPSTIPYVGFIVAALILTWAAIEINRRYFRRRKVDVRTINTWVPLDTTQSDATEGKLSASAKDADEEADDASEHEQNLQTRARQNGHYSESKKPL